MTIRGKQFCHIAKAYLAVYTENIAPNLILTNFLPRKRDKTSLSYLTSSTFLNRHTLTNVGRELPKHPSRNSAKNNSGVVAGNNTNTNVIETIFIFTRPYAGAFQTVLGT